MKTLVQRLRAVSSTEIETMYDLTREAAKEIDRLHAENSSLRYQLKASDQTLAFERNTAYPPSDYGVFCTMFKCDWQGMLSDLRKNDFHCPGCNAKLLQIVDGLHSTR